VSIDQAGGKFEGGRVEGIIEVDGVKHALISNDNGRNQVMTIRRVIGEAVVLHLKVCRQIASGQPLHRSAIKVPRRALPHA
jgi:hypothetical protein